jgi:hypothetical protein
MEVTKKEMMPVVMRGDMLSKQMVNIVNIFGSKIEETDYIDLCLKNCTCP